MMKKLNEDNYVGEIWKDIKNYEDEYEVSNLGRVRNKKTKNILKIELTYNGYERVCLWKNGGKKKYRVHRLVYEAFIGEIPEGMQINHINEIKTDNRIENLNLMTPKENVNWGTAIQRTKETNMYKYLERITGYEPLWLYKE